jgi:endonuclease-3
MNPEKRHEIFRRFREANPEPQTELEHRTPFELLVAVILSAQATDKSVNVATRELFRHARTPAEVLALGQEGLERYIKTIGLYRMKAKNVLETCRRLVLEHGGAVPRTREALEALPGVGRKTANVVLNVAFGEPTIAVDTHIFRVSNRTNIAPGKDPLEVEQRLLKFVPEEFKRYAHHWLILHGRYVCVARKPQCPACIIRDLCEYRQKTTEAAPAVSDTPERPVRETPKRAARYTPERLAGETPKRPAKYAPKRPGSSTRPAVRHAGTKARQVRSKRGV